MRYIGATIREIAQQPDARERMIASANVWLSEDLPPRCTLYDQITEKVSSEDYFGLAIQHPMPPGEHCHQQGSAAFPYLRARWWSPRMRWQVGIFPAEQSVSTQDVRTCITALHAHILRLERLEEPLPYLAQLEAVRPLDVTHQRMCGWVALQFMCFGAQTKMHCEHCNRTAIDDLGYLFGCTAVLTGVAEDVIQTSWIIQKLPLRTYSR